MRIRRLKLTGFKSFVDPTELHIEPGLTGIVGPNGCGKSNLLEAIRWVMGESSARSMRGAGMEDVIFAGTDSRPGRDFAEVTLVAERAPAEDGQDRELEVIRRIERGAGSAYRMNGRDVRAKDIALLFADAATGAHSPALVSQGKIAAVIAAKPTERRQMLEEAAGIAGLHVRRKDAEQKLRATEANLTRLDELLADMEGRVAALRRQARAAERYRALSADIRIAEARVIFARWREAAEAADKAKAEAQAAEEAVIKAAEAQRAAAAWQAEAVSALADKRSAAQASREAATALGHERASLDGERTALVRRIADLARQRETLERDREREGSLANDAAEALARLSEEDGLLVKRIAEAEGRRGALEARTGEAETAARDAEVALAQALAAQAAEQADARVAQAALSAARQRLDRAQRESARLANEKAGLGDEAPLLSARDEAAAARTTAAGQIQASTAAIAAAEAQRDAASAARDAAESNGSAARAALTALEAEARALARAVDSGSGKGAIAKVRAQPGYERALAAALGDDLEAPIGMDGPRGWAGAAAQPGDPALPEGLVPLAMQVQAPQELGRRLAQIGVADTDEGQPLAVGQRLVTRDGRLRRWDGYVATGQGAAAAERLIRLNRLAEIEQALPEAQQAVAGAKMAMDAAQRDMAAAREAIEAARRALANAEAAQRTATRDEDAATNAIERLAGRRTELEGRIGRAEAERGEAETEETQAAAAVAALPDLSQTARSVEMLQQGAALARAAVAQVRAESGALEAAISADRQRMAAARSEAASWRSRAGAAAKRIEEMTARAEAVQQEAEAIADGPAKLDSRLAEVATRLADAEEAARSAQAEEREAEETARRTERAAAEAGELLSVAREHRAGAHARQESQEARRVEMGRISGERFECPAPVLPEKIGFASAEVRDAAAESARHDRLSVDRERLGPVNLVAESELAEIEANRASSIAERDELSQAVNRLRGSIGSLNREGRARLLAAFEAVDGHFRRLFTTLFEGGQAHLALIDSDDPLEAGLEIMAQPPGKKLAALTLLSGGEQALTACALIFALFLTNPAPICVLDEVDAPLDDANIERFCDLLERMTQETDTRYLIVTHNAVTMSRMHRLFGVTMIERGVSRLVSVDLGGAERLLAAE
ncbi:chromosome segregation SMC family protein [Flavisphingomonas formosensis]|uniref:chromosome segregation SMC family protein n=1 Tax=Flavisphingomonas formosensis TaxID=861534 RepID=UPI0012FBCC38|nr:AAA family ATPase [Sphingomonas formosensis]